MCAKQPNYLLRRTAELPLQQRRANAMHRLEAQKRVAATTDKMLLQVDREHDLLLIRLHSFNKMQNELEDEKAAETYESEVVAEYTAKRGQYQRTKREMQKTRELDETISRAEAAKVIEAAGMEARMLAPLRSRERLVSSQDLRAVKRTVDQARALRTTALISLKHHTDEALEELAHENDKKERRKARKEAARAKERRELIATGRNDNAIFGARDVEASYKIRAKRLAKQQRVNEMDILDSLVLEEQRVRARFEKIDTEERHKREYRHAMGHNVIDQELARYRREMMGAEEHKEDYVRGRDMDTHSFHAAEPYSDDDSAAFATTIPAGQAHMNETQDAAALAACATAAAINGEGRASTAATVSSLLSLEDDKSAVVAEREEVKHIPVAFNETRLKLYQKKIAGSLQAQRNRIQTGVTTLVCGKAYHTSTFLASPEIIEFKDLEVGKTYHQKVVVTNVTFSFNTFKLLPVADEYASLFELRYKPVGRMSAGATATITIIFKPEVNKDVTTELRLLAKTGPFNVPIRCYTKKAVLSVSPSVLQLGHVQLGEHGTKFVDIVNDGALSVPFSVDAKEAEGLGLAVAQTGRVAGYSKHRLAVRFAPQIPGPVQQLLRLQFGPEGYKADANSKYGQALQFGSERNFEVTVSAIGEDVPVLAMTEVVDLQTVLHGKLYRSAAILHNRSTAARKIRIDMPRALKGYAEITPREGYLQTGSQLEIQVRLKPAPGLLERVRKCAAQEPESASVDGEEIDVRVRATAAGQTLPVYFRIKARIVDASVRISSTLVEFGDCFTSQAVAVPLTLTNGTPLLQKFAFVDLPEFVTVQPEDGLLSVLPHSERILHLVFRPVKPTAYNFNLVVWTQQGGREIIKCSGRGVVPPIEFEGTVVKIAPVSDGGFAVASTLITNTSNTPKVLDFILPENKDAKTENAQYLSLESFLVIAPRVLRIEPHGTARIEIHFDPHVVNSNSEAPSATVVTEMTDVVEVQTAGDSRSTSKGGKRGSKTGPGSRPSTTGKGGKGAAAAAKAEEEAAAAVAAEEAEREAQRLAAEAEAAAQAAGAAEEKRREHENPEEELNKHSVIHFSTGRVDQKVGEDSSEAEPWSRHARHRIACFVQDLNELDQHSTSSLMSVRELHKRAESRASVAVMHLEVHTTVVLPALKVSATELDFGPVAAGKAVTRTLRLTNQGTEELDLKAAPLGLGCPFRILSALRPLPVGESCFFVVEFLPARQEPCYAKLQLLCAKSSVIVAVRLHGQGVVPKLRLVPEEGLIDMGDVVVGGSSSRNMTVHNDSSFPVTFNVQPQSKGERNIKGLTEFFVVPGVCTIEPNSSQDITINFCPDHSSQRFAAVMDVMGRQMRVTGRCHDDQMCVYTSARWPDESMEQNPLAMLDLVMAKNAPAAAPTKPAGGAPEGKANKSKSSATAAASAAADAVAAAAPVGHVRQVEIVLREDDDLDDVDREMFSKQLIVASCTDLPPNEKGAAGSYEFELDDATGCFSVDSAQGPLAMGTTKEVTFNFDLNKHRSQSAGGHRVWLTCRVQCTLKGGFSPAGSVPAPVQVVLRALAN